MEHIITAYIIPAFAILMSLAFWFNGRDSAKRAEQLLDEVTKTSRGWQKDIMDSANQMLNTRPEIAAHQLYMSKIDAVNKLTDAIKSIAEDIAKNLKEGEAGKIQTANLKMLLDYQFHYFNTVLDNKPIPKKVNNIDSQSTKNSQHKNKQHKLHN